MINVNPLYAEIERLRAENKILLETLKLIAEWPFDFIAEARDEARAAIEKAGEK